MKNLLLGALTLALTPALLPAACHAAAPLVAKPRCPFAASSVAAHIPDDGCSGSSKHAPQHPEMMNSYGKNRPPFDVAGVDYYVGNPGGRLKDPSTAALPAGCAYAANKVSCTSSNATISGYDFSLHGGIQLYLHGGISNVTVTRNKFGLAPRCVDPSLDILAGGAVTITNNTFNGGGAACNNLVFGTLINGIYDSGAVVTLQYNAFYDTPQDVADFRGPNSGAATINYKNNFIDMEGYTGHPDGIQLNGGNFNPINVSFNTYYNTTPPNTVAGTQPFHIEAQLGAALSNSTVSYNTLMTPGSCDGGHNWPVGCAINFDIACKNDPGWVDSNVNFSAYGNYIDSTGGIAGLTNAYSCTGTSWGSPAPNMSLITGQPLGQP